MLRFVLRRTVLRVGVASLVTMALAAGCSDDPAATSPPDAGVDAARDASPPTVVVPDASPPVDAALPTTVSKLIGPKGGTARIGEMVLTIPPDTLSIAELFTVSVSTAAPPAGYDVYSTIYHFAPDGFTFGGPVTVEIPFKSGSPSPSIYWSKPGGGGGFEKLPTTINGSVASASVRHFSDGFVGQFTGAGLEAGAEDASTDADAASASDASTDVAVADASKDAGKDAGDAATK